MAELTGAGADVARANWICALGFSDGTTELHLMKLSELVARHGGAPVAIDIPIGLPDEQGPRACDEQARTLLGHRRSVVFAPPARFLIDAADYTEMRRRVAARGGAGISAQAAALAPRIREVDAYVRSDRSSEDWLLECHPELAFARLAGAALPDKRSPAGAVRRLALIAESFPDAPERLRAAPWSSTQVALDDALDAYACLTVALRSERDVLGGERDSAGVCMRMFV
jgi:predicted RNase H-like nuclease